MALVLAFDDAKTKQVREEGSRTHSTGGYTHTPFFGSPDNLHLPHAALNQRDSARTASTHFHVSDQFQVVIGGKGKLGRHDVAAYCVHFARAYTPYGPLVSDDTGLTFIVLRAHHDPGAQFLPENKDKLKQVPNRQPWQITRPFTFPTPQSGTAVQDIMLQAIPDIKDELGLAAYTLSMKPHATARAPDPSHGEGQYLVVLKGSLLHDNKEHKALALAFVEPNEDAFQIHAGSAGLEAIVLNFPQVKLHTVRALAPSTVAGFKKWQCALCSFAYDETLGMPEEGILAGTRWEDVPDNWSCPDCSASKSEFQMVEI